MLYSSFYVVLGFAASAVVLGWVYFRRYQVTRPPVGVIGLGDVAVMIGAIVSVPYLYLALPLWLVVGIFALAMLSILYFTAEPILRSRRALWLVVLALVGADVGINLLFGATSIPFLVVNDAVLVLGVVGATNLWAQGGMKARDITVLAVVLALYDLIATSLLPLTSDLLTRLAQIPLAPLVTWGSGSDQLSIGLGDLLLMTVFPLVMRKAYGRPAGIAAIAIGLGTIAALMVLLQLGNVYATVPVMSVLGPLMALQYGYWLRRRGQERTMRQYLQPEPLNKSIASERV
jgi:hypothetical protein